MSRRATWTVHLHPNGRSGPPTERGPAGRYSAKADEGPVVGALPEVVVVTGFSKREIEVLRLLASGKTSREVAEQLELSRRTVDNHAGRFYKKLGVSNRVQAVRRAVELGILSIDDVG